MITQIEGWKINTDGNLWSKWISTKKSKYSKLLNNLLGIKINDACLFSRITSSTYDVYTKLGCNIGNDLLIKPGCKVKIKELDFESLISELKTIQKDFKEELKNKNFLNLINPDAPSEWDDWKFYGERVISTYAKFNHPISNILKTSLLTLHDASILDEALIKLEQEKQKSLNRWKKIVKLADDKQNLTNNWPLYIASGFISIDFAYGKVINAPLLLKEARITVNESTVTLETTNDWIINDKLIYILKRHDLFVSDEIKTEDKSFIELMDEILAYLKIEERNLNFYNNKFKNLKSDEIKNKKIELKPGILLGFFYPSGGYLREWMQKIIDNDEVDDILKIQPDKKIYEDKVYDVLKNNYGEIVKIQESSYAQDKALISALNQDTVIWGPPGTGKSQVIANIIANILYKQKSAIVMSQKGAALDVLKKRLKGLSRFVFFFTQDGHLSKEEFYTPLKEFIKIVEYSRSADYRKDQYLVEPKQIDVINKISELKNKGKYQAVIQAYKNVEGDVRKIKRLANVNPEYNYPVNVDTEDDFKDLTVQLNNIKKNGYIFWWKYSDKFNEDSKNAFLIKKLLNLNNLSEMVKPFRIANIDDMHYLSQAPNILRHDYQYIDDEKFTTSFLSSKILEKIKTKFTYDPIQFKKYDRFRAAINAGRRLPHNFVRDHFEVIQELFPIIITTPSTVFVNFKKEVFDYSIIDEASQMFLEEGLPIMYLSKIKILAGDPEQMQPTSWFSTRDISDDEDEADNIENAVSVLNYALDKQVYQVMLDQNYRSSAASLMSFSSKEFYKSKLEVINKKEHWDKKPIEVINVDGQWNKGTNQREAEKVIELLKKFENKYNTIIVLAFNIKQKQLIEQLLVDNEPNLWNQKVARDKTITIRNIENIQGDEADLVIVSVVYDETTKMGGTYVAREGTGKNALNVAISRAKDKMVVVKSVNANKIGHANSEDFNVFREWLFFLDLKEEQQRTYSTLQESKIQYGDFESTFEEDVYQKLMQDIRFEDGKSYEITRQFPVGSKRIDIAILNNQKEYILGIEVDGYNYHLGMGIDKYLQDHSRAEFLKSKGYRLLRIPEIRWYLDSNNVVNKIQKTLNNIILN